MRDVFHAVVSAFLIVVCFIGMGIVVLWATSSARLEAAPNCRQYLDRAQTLAQRADRQDEFWGTRQADAQLALAWAKIAEVCTKF